MILNAPGKAMLLSLTNCLAKVATGMSTQCAQEGLKTPRNQECVRQLPPQGAKSDNRSDRRKMNARARDERHNLRSSRVRAQNHLHCERSAIRSQTVAPEHGDELTPIRGCSMQWCSPIDHIALSASSENSGIILPGQTRSFCRLEVILNQPTKNCVPSRCAETSGSLNGMDSLRQQVRQ